MNKYEAERIESIRNRSLAGFSIGPGEVGWLCDFADAQAIEIKRLTIAFTGDPDQPPLQQIRAKCEQYWNLPIAAPETHAALGFIHGLAVEAEKQQAIALTKAQGEAND